MATLTAMTFLAACTNIVPVTKPPRQALEENFGSTVVVTLTGGEQLTVRRAHIVRDSLKGVLAHESSSGEIAIPVDGIRSVAKEKTDVGRTVGAVILSVAVVGGILAILVSESLSHIGM